MEKRYYSPMELLKIATQHATCADTLLNNKLDSQLPDLDEHQDCLLSIISLMYIAFDLTLKAYLIHDHRPVKQFKSLLELLELNRDLVFSSQEQQLLRILSRQYAFRKGIDYEIWQDRQQFLIFCHQIVALYEKLQAMMPLELQEDYQ
ncbi:Uncharacterised protein [Legionella busanensis]|uniref:Uncharacterized protein n=1 Tax=Legionella busanensis TaxID=190655 RepID=A0A378JNM2_9GAMM|nr:hypothetical protein [Legionella busanensis]STX52845.1 Uncharacterised protein [Legionella busanensis]